MRIRRCAVCIAFAIPIFAGFIYALARVPSMYIEGKESRGPLSFIKNYRLKRQDVNPLGKETIAELDWSNTQKSSLRNEFYDTKYSGLEILKISNCGLTDIYTRAFEGLSELKELDLSKNLLKTIDRNIIKNNKQLETLNLSYNHIELINTFLISYSVITLDLSFNNITNVQSYAFNNLKNLRTLFFNGNVMNEKIKEDILKTVSCMVYDDTPYGDCFYFNYGLNLPISLSFITNDIVYIVIVVIVIVLVMLIIIFMRKRDYRGNRDQSSKLISKC